MSKYPKWLIPLFIIATSCGKGIGIPELLDPTGGETVSLPVTFIWTSVENAKGYAIEIDTTTAFENPIISAEVDETTHTVTNLDTLKYYWRVSSIDENGEKGDFSDPDSFIVQGSAYPRNLITTIQLPGEYPATIDITPDGSELWVGYWGQTDTIVTVIATATNQITHEITTTNPGNDLGELRISADGNHAYFCGVWDMDSSGLIELSTSSYRQIRMMGYPSGSPPVKQGPDGPGIALGKDYVYAAHMATVDDGYITRIDLASGSPIDSLHMSWIADVDLNHAGTRLYAVGEEDSLYEIDPATLTVTRQIGVGYAPHRLVITGDDRYAFVTGDSIYVVDLNTFTVVKKFDPDISAEGLKLTPDENYLYITDGGSNYIDIYDVSDPTDPTLVEKLQFPQAGSFNELVFNKDGSRAYIIEESGDIFVLGK
ncbi:hypothetical protein DRP53_00375 [candidate division WOR-3 bacterium]|uniref:Fibronectin type-III domain-containing protein n=1 Tax=candidate division WOR-3 bacterium TaxID=2052148 RepID=A0A660SLP9_UNCW3|nr:MAG: hypothetical protein DRP53_00375 [candidate division WOR-3 bacterium]